MKNFFEILLVCAIALSFGCQKESSHENFSDASEETDGPSDGGDKEDAGDDAGDQDIPDAEPLPPMPCIEDWPEFPDVASVPSLPKTEGAWGEVLWRKKLNWSTLRGSLAFDGHHLAVVSGNVLSILDTKGEIVGEFKEFSSMLGSDVVADGKGNFLFSSQSLFLITPTGEKLWSTAFGQNISYAYETTETSKILLSPDGIAYVATTDGFLYAIKADNGEIVWRKEVGLREGYNPVPLNFGVGNMIFIDGTPYSRPYNRMIGERFEKLTMDGEPLIILSGTTKSMIGRYPYRETDNIFFLFDRCRNFEKKVPNADKSLRFEFVSFDDFIVTTEKRTIHIYDSSGLLVVEPTEVRGLLKILGADNIIYLIGCEPEGAQNIYIEGYDDKLSRVYYQEYETTSCPITISPVLSDDGTLFVAIDNLISGIEIFAIRTWSPGVAKTAWPMEYQNNRRTGWLAPGQ